MKDVGKLKARQPRPRVRDELARVLEESGSVDAFAHGLMGFLVELAEAHPAHPLVLALGEQLSQAASIPFTASAMHDMRSLLSGVSMSLEFAPVLLERSGVLDDSRPTDPHRVALLMEALEDARVGTRTAGDLAREAFELHRSAVKSTTIRTTVLNGLVETAVRLAQSRVPVDLLLETEAACEVLARRNDLLRVLVNLLGNAAHAIEELDDPEDARIRVSTWATPEYAFVQIADDGPGIPAATLAEIFELFFTTHGEGTGIGLHVCKTLVEGWGGLIHVDSADGEGASFTFSIPLHRP